jgi:hypothetical protein
VIHDPTVSQTGFCFQEVLKQALIADGLARGLREAAKVQYSKVRGIIFISGLIWVVACKWGEILEFLYFFPVWA